MYGKNEFDRICEWIYRKVIRPLESAFERQPFLSILMTMAIIVLAVIGGVVLVNIYRP